MDLTKVCALQGLSPARPRRLTEDLDAVSGEGSTPSRPEVATRAAGVPSALVRVGSSIVEESDGQYMAIALLHCRHVGRVRDGRREEGVFAGLAEPPTRTCSML